MGHGRRDKWSADQVAVVRAAAVQGMSAEAIHRALVAGELPGYRGDVMPRGTISYHHTQARRKVLDAARAASDPKAIDELIGGLLGDMLKGAEVAARKAQRELRASKAGSWQTLEDASKALLAAHRVSRAINAAKPGQQDAKPPTKANGDNTTEPADLVSRIAQREGQTAAQPG